MDKSADLKQFVDRILAISPSYTNGLTTALPGIAGSASSSSVDVIHRLHHEISTFASLISRNQLPEAITASMKTIEGYLSTLETLGQISSKLSSSLIAELYELTDA